MEAKIIIAGILSIVGLNFLLGPKKARNGKSEKNEIKPEQVPVKEEEKSTQEEKKEN